VTVTRGATFGTRLRRASMLAGALVLVAGSPALAATKPANTALPVISGTASVGKVLTVSKGTWTGTAPITYAYQWKRCTSTGASCVNIAGATASTRLLAAADNGRRLKAVVTAKNSAGSLAKTTAASAIVTTAVKPAMTAAPVVSGTARSGQTLSATNGTWTGTAPITYAVAWFRCPDAGPCAQAGTGASYGLTDADVGRTMGVQVTATNGVGSTAGASLPTATVLAAPPVNTGLPAVQGTAAGGQTLTRSPGSWNGTPAITFATTWRRCDTAGANCTDVATTDSYVVTAADLGHRMVVVVTATNAAAAVAATSPPSAIVQPTGAPPQNTAPPTVTGTPVDGGGLTGDPGTWTGVDPSLAFQWLRCTEPGLVCSPVAGATAAAYPLSSADVGQHLAFQVTASDIGGSTTATSALTGVVAAVAPASSGLPQVTGTAKDGSALSATPGTWTGTTPMTFAFAWQRCDATPACAPVGTDSAAYQLIPADIGFTVQVTVTASNGAGPGTPATSSPTAVVVAAAPENTGAPTIGGTPAEGSTLTALAGDWTGTAPIGYAYVWRRCTGATCSDASGSTADPSYVVAGADVGKSLLVVVTASNTGGTAGASSASTAPVGAVGPSPTAPPTIGGTPQVGATLTSTPGGWDGTPPLAYTYQWQVCDATGNACAAADPPETDPTYLVKTYDAGQTVVVQVTATNSAGPASNVSAATGQVAAGSGPVTVALWHMDDTDNAMRDASGYKNRGSQVNVQEDVPGAVGRAFRFSGDPSRVEVPHARSLLAGTKKWTISLRVRFAAAPSAATGDYDLIRKGLGTSPGGDWKVEILQTGKAMCFGQGASGHVLLTGGPNIANNAWHTILCVQTATNIKLFVDGVQVGSKNGTIGTISNTETLTIGAKIIDGDQYAGDLDEVSIVVG
jgi:hypothetical protein